MMFAYLSNYPTCFKLYKPVATKYTLSFPNRFSKVLFWLFKRFKLRSSNVLYLTWLSKQSRILICLITYDLIWIKTLPYTSCQWLLYMHLMLLILSFSIRKWFILVFINIFLVAFLSCQFTSVICIRLALHSTRNLKSFIHWNLDLRLIVSSTINA